MLLRRGNKSSCSISTCRRLPLILQAERRRLGGHRHRIFHRRMEYQLASKKDDEPRTFEDFGDPKWANRLSAEPRDYPVLLGLAKYKYQSDDKAIEIFKKIASNKPEFFKGHSQLAELLTAGQADVCVTCYAHHIPPLQKKGAPLQIMMTEGVGRIGGSVTLLQGRSPSQRRFTLGALADQ